jgi:2-polyprenyl-6-methoxyphenol hydroxylase-like FAD-dependent oxidoreductase
MADWIAELAVQIYYGCEVTGFAQDATGVDVELSGGQSLRAEYLLGCDGGRSVIRKAAGIEFPGWEPTRSNLIAEVEVTEEPPRGIRRDATGVLLNLGKPGSDAIFFPGEGIFRRGRLRLRSRREGHRWGPFLFSL